MALTAAHQLVVLAVDGSGQLRQLAAGQLADPVGEPAERLLARIDPRNRLMAFYLTEGMLKVVPIDSKGTAQDSFNLRLPDRNLAALCFPALPTAGVQSPAIAYVCRDGDVWTLRSHTINVREKTLSDGPYPSVAVPSGTSCIEPLGSGVLCLGDSEAVWVGPGQSALVTVRFPRDQPSVCGAMCRLDDSRWLCGDELGNLWLIAVTLAAGGLVSQLGVELMGHTSIASALCYLDNGCVFVGSALGDSQVVRLLDDPDVESGQLVETLEVQANLGPVMDMEAVDIDGQGQSSLVLASGGFQDGTLRVVRNGIGVNVEAELPLPNITGVWAMRAQSSAKEDRFVCVSFASQTIFLALEEDDDLAEMSQSGGLLTDARTLFCGTTLGDQLVQITPRGVRLVDAGPGHALRETWEPHEGQSITVCGAHGQTGQVVVGLAHTLVYLRVVGLRLVEQGRTQLDSEAACVDCTPLAGGSEATVCAVGTWGPDAQVELRELPSLTRLNSEALGAGGVVARSVRLASFEDGGEPRLLVGLGDGRLLQYRLLFTGWQMLDRKQVPLGTQACLLTPLPGQAAASSSSDSGSGLHSYVFAGGDRPAVVYSSSRKLVVANVNLQNVSSVCSFSTTLYPNCLCMATRESLLVGSLESIQQLHTHTVPLEGEMARRICHIPSSHVFVAGCTKRSRDGVLRVLDEVSFERLAEFQLDRDEVVCSLIGAGGLGDGSLASFVVAGTAFVLEKDPEPQKGRILVLLAERSDTGVRLSLMHELAVSGAVYSLVPLGNRLAAGVGPRVELFDLLPGPPVELRMVADHFGHVLALHLKARGEFLLVGDLMRSFTLLRFDPVIRKLVVLARDYSATWLMATAFAGEDVFLGCDSDGNLLLKGRAEDADSTRMVDLGSFHLGPNVNVLRPGRLVMPDPSLTLASPPPPPLLWGAVDGSLGAIVPISEESYLFFKTLEEKMAQLPQIGNLRHADWRAVKSKPHSAFVDGDLVEHFLELSSDDQAYVAAGMDTSVDDITQRVEDMARSIH